MSYITTKTGRVPLIEVSRYTRVKGIKNGKLTTISLLETCNLPEGSLPLLNCGQEVHFKPGKHGEPLCSMAYEDKRYRWIGSDMLNGFPVARYIPRDTLLK